MNTEILEALGAITREKNVERSVLVETLEAGLISAGKKKFGATANIEVKFDNVSGKIEMARVLDVVETVEDPALQCTLEDAVKTHPDAAVGTPIRFPLEVADFGRNAIQAAKQVLIQRVREAERDRVFQEFTGKIATLVRGVVQQVDRGNVIVKLDRAEGIRGIVWRPLTRPTLWTDFALVWPHKTASPLLLEFVVLAQQMLGVDAAAGGSVIVLPFDIPIGRGCVVRDGRGNQVVLLDTSKDLLVTDQDGNGIGNCRS